jgi:uncharacterized protein (UPF0335 family)
LAMTEQTTMTMTVGGITTGPFTLGDLKEATAKLTGKAPMKQDAEDKATIDRLHNSTGQEIRAFIERLEQLDAEKAEIADQMKEVMAEAKGRGYDTKVLRKIIALRKRDKDDIAEEEAVLQMYLSALGMA